MNGRGRFLPLAAAAAALLAGGTTAARAQDADPAAAAAAAALGDGVWAIAGARAPLDRRGSNLALYAGHLGGLRNDFVFLEGQVRFGGGFGALAGYAYSVSDRAGGGGGRGDARAHLGRIGATIARPLGRAELDARLLGEVLAPEDRAGTPRGRLRLRATLPVGGVAEAVRPRLFVADEVFVEGGRGFSRNRVNAGLRATLGGALDLDLYYLREDRDDGRGFHALVVQAVLGLGAK